MAKHLRPPAPPRTPSTHDFQFIGGSLALDFVNTVGNRLGARRDYFESAEDVRRWTRLADLDAGGPSFRSTAKQLQGIRSIREKLYSVFRSLLSRRRVSMSHIRFLNFTLNNIQQTRQLRLRKGKVHWEWRTSPHDQICILGPVLLDAAEVLVSGTFTKLRQCSDETCGWLFLDSSQVGKRRWCSMRDCGNRAKASRHYLKNSRGKS